MINVVLDFIEKNVRGLFKALPRLEKCFSTVRGNASGANMKVILVRSFPGRAPSQLASQTLAM